MSGVVLMADFGLMCFMSSCLDYTRTDEADEEDYLVTHWGCSDAADQSLPTR